MWKIDHLSGIPKLFQSRLLVGLCRSRIGTGWAQDEAVDTYRTIMCHERLHDVVIQKVRIAGVPGLALPYSWWEDQSEEP